MANSVATGRVVPTKTHGQPRQFRRPLLIAVAPYKGWLLGQPVGSAYAQSLVAGTGQIALGYCDRDQAAGASSGSAIAILNSGIFSGLPASVIANDAHTEADFMTVAWGANNQTVGKLSNSGGVSRSMVGVFYGIDNDPGPTASTPMVLGGPEGWIAARAVHMADSAVGGSLVKAIDPDATTDTINGLAEAMMDRPKLHGTITAIDLLVEGTTLAASGATNFTTTTVWKRDGAGGAAVSVGTMTTVAATTQFTAKAFVLSVVAGALDLLETDILTVTKTHGASGAITPAGKIRVTQRVM